MNSNHDHIEVCGVSVEVIRKDIRNLYLRVAPPHGQVRVSVPRGTHAEAVRRLVISKLPWIERQQARLQRLVPRREPQMRSGEVHAVFGRPHRLEVTEGAARNAVCLREDSVMELMLRPGTGKAKRRAILNDWYRAQLKQRIPGLIAAWEPVLDVEVADWGVRKMKTLWGSCNIRDCRIWLNLELARRSLPCLDYVVLHEMVHLLERRHDRRFQSLMDTSMPAWRLHREELNSTRPAFE